MSGKFLLDTNVIIYYFNGILDDAKIHLILRDSFNISIITKIEFLSWNKLLNDKELHQKSIDFISNANIYDLDESIANQTIKIRQKYHTKAPDAIIAATALVNGFDIVTNNVDDFKNLNLEIVTVKIK